MSFLLMNFTVPQNYSNFVLILPSVCRSAGQCQKFPPDPLGGVKCQILNLAIIKVRKRAKIRNRYYQAPHLTQDTNRKVTTAQLDITNESQEVSPFPAGDHKASINRRARKQSKNKTEIT